MTEAATAQAGAGEGGAAPIEEKPTTVVGAGDPPADASAAAAASGWPDNWRDLMAGDDQTFRKQLDRMAGPGEVGKSFLSLQRRMSSGELKRGLPENATAEQVAEWRRQNGIPETADGYSEKLSLPNGMVVGEADKPIVAQFAAAAHASNVDPAAFSAMVGKYYELQDAKRAAEETADEEFHTASVAALQKEWTGADYRRNVTAVNNLLSTWPKETRDNFLAGRTPEGRKLGDDPAIIRQLAAMALELNPVGTLLPGASGDPAKGLSDRLAELKKMMSDSSSDYWRGPKADDLQKEYRDLLDAQNRMNARAA